MLGAGCGSDAGGRNKPAGVNPAAGKAGSDDETGGTTGTGGGSASGGGAGATGGNGGTDPGASGFGDAPDRNAVKAGGLCERLSTIQCAGEELCCDAPGRDFAACKTTMKAGCETSLYLDKISLDPRSGFDAARAKTVFEMIETKAMACDPGTAAFGESADGLRGIFQGTVAPRGSCPPDVGNKAKAAAALASCKDPGANACLPNPPLGITWSCAPRSAAGGPCFTDINCNAGLYCPNPSLVPVPASACAARKADGATCAAPYECGSLFCKGGKCVAADKQAAYCLKQ